MGSGFRGDARVVFEREDVHVWRAELDLGDAATSELLAVLSADEHARAGRYRFDRDRRRFVVARARLRAILGLSLGAAPGDMRFVVDAREKPHLADASAHGLQFSVSHCDGTALYAVARRRRVGVDLERIREDIDWEPVADRFFSPREVAGLRALAPERRAAAFTRLWTRKEAWLKARGDGLADGEHRLRDEPGADGGAWSIWTLDADPGYAAALVVEPPPSVSGTPLTESFRGSASSAPGGGC